MVITWFWVVRKIFFSPIFFYYSLRNLREIVWEWPKTLCTIQLPYLTSPVKLLSRGRESEREQEKLNYCVHNAPYWGGLPLCRAAFVMLSRVNRDEQPHERPPATYTFLSYFSLHYCFFFFIPLLLLNWGGSGRAIRERTRFCSCFYRKKAEINFFFYKHVPKFFISL